MVDLATLQAFSYIMGSLGVFIAAIYYVINVRNTVQNRKAQLFMQLGEHMINPAEIKSHYEMMFQWEWEDNDDFQRKYGLGNLDNFSKFLSLGVLLTFVGQLVDLKLVDDRTARNQFGFRLRRFFEKYETVIKEGRELFQSRTLWNSMEDLYKEWYGK